MRLGGGGAAEASCFSVLGQVLCFRGPVNLPLQHTTLHPKATLSLSGCPLSLLDHFVQAPSPNWGQVAGEKGMLEPSCIPAPQFLLKRQLGGGDTSGLLIAESQAHSDAPAWLSWEGELHGRENSGPRGCQVVPRPLHNVTQAWCLPAVGEDVCARHPSASD